ncbi:hypothetical protein PPSIR1_34437 [Plesiocystis pacifica SIR-1]|uniref:Uncharacterized protein n=2 Tax=Plesiocystis pacifica TaxID=191768 RepID=A6G7P5_9BACT|nr:hypothetical protein PPSIR1_34437 [Plesiocystis pacifica SIR-1]
MDMSPIAQAILVYAVLAIGVLITALTGAAQLRELPRALEGKASDALSRRGFLAASVGMGSVGGSMLALELGGPGAIAWMWVASLLGMALIYAEVRLSVRLELKRRKQRRDDDAPVQADAAAVLTEYLPAPLGRPLAALFCLALMIFGVSAGAVLQTQQSAFILEGLMVDPSWVVMSLAGVAAIGMAVPRLRTLVAAIGPVAVALYVVALVLIIARAPGSPGEALASILGGFTGSDAALGGAAGGGVLIALQAGFLRATLATEAGLGSSGFTPEADRARDPERTAASVMLVPLVSGALVPTITALAVLTTAPSALRIDEPGERRPAADARVASEAELEELAELFADGDVTQLDEADALKVQAAWIPLELPQSRGTAGSLQTGQTVILPTDVAIEADASADAAGLRRDHVYPMVMRSSPRGTKMPVKEGINKIIIRYGPEAEGITEVVFRDKDPKRRNLAAYDIRVAVTTEVAGPENAQWMSLTPVDEDIDLYRLSKVRDGPYVVYGDFTFGARIVRMFHQKWGNHDAVVAADQNEWRPLSLRTTVESPSYRGPYLDDGSARPPVAMVAREGFDAPIGSRLPVELRSPSRGLDVGQLLASGEYITPPWRFLMDTTHAVLRHKTDPAQDIRIPVTVEFRNGYLHFLSGDPKTADFAKAARWRDYTGPYLDAPAYAFDVEVHSAVRVPASQAYLDRKGLERQGLTSPYAERRALVAVHPELEAMGSRRELYDPHPAEVAPFMDGPYLSASGRITVGANHLAAAAAHGLDHGGDILLGVCVLILALTTMVAWSSYGARAADFVFGQGAGIGYRVVFVIGSILAVGASAQSILRVADHAMIVLVVLNGVALILGTLQVRKEGRK